ADSVRESGNARAVVANFDTIADAADTEFLLVEIVHQHRVLLLQRLDTPMHHIPRLPHAAAGTDADDLNAFNAAVGTLPARECLHVLFGFCDTGGCEDLVELALGERPSGVKIANSAKGDPQVGFRMVDIVRRRRGEAEKQAKLDDDQNEGEHNAGEGDGKAYAVVEEVASCE